MASMPLLLAAACAVDPSDPDRNGPLSVDEALTAVLEINDATAGDRATADVIDVSTDFTIGGRIADILNAIANFWDSQESCTTVSVDGNVVTVDFGSLDDGCTFDGHTYGGLDTITVTSTDTDKLRLTHDWDQFTNGDVTVDGTSTVTWSPQDDTRRVETDFVFANFLNASITEVRGDHVTGRLHPDLPVWQAGFTLDGTREWTSGDRDWSVALNHLELRMVDAAPQGGSAVLTDDEGRILTIVYGRVDMATTSALVTGPDGGAVLFLITANGTITES